jgi:hypothetical protein
VVVVSLGATALVSAGVATGSDESFVGATSVRTGSPGSTKMVIGGTGGVVVVDVDVSARASVPA